MSKTLFVRSSLFISLMVGFAGCTVHPTPTAPELAGPSGLGKSLTVTAAPDSITADGSMSTITMTVFGPDGKGLADVPLQMSLSVQGTPVSWGYLSSQTIYTDGTGRAKAVYYSPAVNGFFAGTPAKEVWVTVAPVGANYITSMPVSASIKVTPPPVPIFAADSPTAAVTYTPTAAKVGQLVMFDASASAAASGRSIVSYFWDFGDNLLNDEHGSDASHAYAAPGTYTMVLGVTDDAGHSSSVFKQIVVSN